MIVYSNCKSKKFKNKDVLDAITFFDRKLLSEKLSRNITVKVKTKPRSKMGGADGECSWETNDAGRVRNFTIRLADHLSFKKMIQTLAHEMVHVKQYAKGELKYLDKLKASRYNGELYHLDDHSYWDLPWEIEAYGREAGLYFRYMMYLDEKNCV
jgi:hypothetical protein